MIVDERCYILKTGQLRRFMDRYLSEGYPLQRRHLGEPFGLFSIEFGDLDGWVHMWSYTDVSDRARRRANLAADKGWQEFQRKTGDLIVERRNRLLVRIKTDSDQG